MRDFLARTYDLLLKGGAAVAGFFHGLSNDNYQTAVLLLALMVADYISGIVAAALGKSKKSPGGKLSSEAGAKGLLRKALILVVVLLAYLLDWFANEGNAMFSAAACWFYISNESLSLLENLAIAGVPVPKKIIGMFERMTIDEEGGAGKVTGQPETSAIAQAGENAPSANTTSANAQYASAPSANVPSANATFPAQEALHGQSSGQNG